MPNGFRNTSIVVEEGREARKQTIMREFCVRGDNWKQVGPHYKLNAKNNVLYPGGEGLRFRHPNGAEFILSRPNLVVGEFKDGKIHFQDEFYTLHTLGKEVVPSRLPYEAGDVLCGLINPMLRSLRGLA